MFSLSSPWNAAVVLTAVEIVGDTAAKMNSAVTAFASYNVLAYVLTQALPYNNLALTNGYWNAMTNITHAALGVAVFGESLSAAQLLGLVLISGGIILLA